MEQNLSKNELNIEPSLPINEQKMERNLPKNKNGTKFTKETKKAKTAKNRAKLPKMSKKRIQSRELRKYFTKASPPQLEAVKKKFSLDVIISCVMQETKIFHQGPPLNWMI